MIYAILASTYGFAPPTDEAFLVEKINSYPGVTWTAKVGAMGGRKMGSLMGVKDPLATLKLPKHVSNIRDADVPDTFDSATQWPKCAKVISDIRDQSMCGCCCETSGLKPTRQLKSLPDCNRS